MLVIHIRTITFTLGLVILLESLAAILFFDAAITFTFEVFLHRHYIFPAISHFCATRVLTFDYLRRDNETLCECLRYKWDFIA